MVKINRKLKNSLVRENLFFFIANNIMNLLVFFFHFYMGRVLGPANYGILGALLALVYLFAIMATTIQTSIAKFVSKFDVKKQYGKINFLLKTSLRKLTVYGIILNILFILIVPFLSDFLKISTLPLIILSFMITFEFLLPTIRGLLQGLQRFNSLGINLILEGAIKLFFGILLVFAGFGVNGAVIAIVLSYILPFFFGFYNLRHILKNRINKFDIKKIYSYTLPVLIMLISLTIFYNIDLILVKHFFSNEEAGYYSAAGLLGKILFFGSISISQVMFAKVSGLYENKKPHKHLLKKSLIIISLLTILGLVFYYLFPSTIINILFGKSYLSTSNLILWSGIMMAIFSLIYSISFYNISIHKTKFIYLLILFNILEIIMIYLFHNSLLQIFISISALLTLLLFILLIKTFWAKDDKIIYNNSSL